MIQMKILYLHQYFCTNDSSSGTRSYEFSKYLSKNDIEVNIISGTDSEIEFNNNENLFLYTTKTKYDQKMSKWRRILAFVDYSLKAFLKGLIIKDIDIIFASSTPLTIGLPAVLLSKLKRNKLIFEVRDVWPDIPIELGYIKNKYFIKILKIFELWIYNNSSHIIVLSKGMYRYLIKKGISSEKITVIENMANVSLYNRIKNIKKNNYFKDKFICIHPGSMGYVNDLNFILDVAKFTRIDSDIIFLLIGNGGERNKLIERIESEYIQNVIIKDSIPKKKLIPIIKLSDVGICVFNNKYKILENNSANKFFDFLAAGLPILINYEGWQKEVLEEVNCGRSLLKPEDMASEIINLKNNENLRLEMSKNSKILANEKYSDKIAKRKLLELIRKIDSL